MNNLNFESLIQSLDDALTSGDGDQVNKLLDISDTLDLTNVQKEIIEKRRIFFLWAIGEKDTAFRRLKQAIKHGISAREASNDWIDIKLIQAYLESLHGHAKSAEKTLEQTLKKKDIPEESKRWLILNLSCMYRDKGAWEKAEKHLEELAESEKSTPEMRCRSALILAEMATDLRHGDVSGWTRLIEREAPFWGGWECLVTARILDALSLIRKAEYTSGLEVLFKCMNESNQSTYLRPKIRLWLALAEAMLHLGVWDDVKSYLSESKQCLDSIPAEGMKHFQFEAERLWAEMVVLCSDDKSKLLSALDRMEILLAVVAKYPKPPGVAPFWLTIGRIQGVLENHDAALKAFERAKREALKYRSRYHVANALFLHAAHEWTVLSSKEKKSISPPRRNKILSKTSEALDATSRNTFSELEWRLHFLRGRIFRKTGDEFPATQEFNTAAQILLNIVDAIPDRGLQRAFLNKKDMKDVIDILNPFIEKIRERRNSLDTAGSSSVDIKNETTSDIHTGIQSFKAMITALYDIQSVSSIRSLFLNWMQHIRTILCSDRVWICMDEDDPSGRKGMELNESGLLSEIELRVPQAWIYEVKLSRTSARFVLEADAHIPEKRQVLVVPLLRNGHYEGVLVLDRSFSVGPYRIDEIELLSTLNNAALMVYSTIKLQLRMSELTKELNREVVQEFPRIIGESELMRKLFLQIQKVSRSDIPITIVGETGTGKDLIARTIHEISPRKHKPFVHLDCSAIPITLLEAELFGIDKGVATGVDSRIGLLEYADGGTIVLDEVSDIPLSVQAKLLRVLQEQEFQAIGSNKTVHVDIRIISTSTSDMLKAVKEKRLREDFFYRINGVTINVPPLRYRHGDVILLARFFLEKYKKQFGKNNIVGFSRGALELMNIYPWPGNVRELEHHVRKAVLFSEKEIIDFDDLELMDVSGAGKNLKYILEQREKEIIRDILVLSGGDVKRTASILGIGPDRVEKVRLSSEFNGKEYD